MNILSINLKHFRCFESLDIQLEHPLIGIIGHNGTGKTSILEALHYMCYLRSFKTHSVKELINLNSSGCSISLNLSNNLAFDTLQATLVNQRRTVKLNEKNISTYKELYNNYKTITIAEEDMLIIKGAPQIRRSFIDQMLMLLNPSYITLLKKHKVIVDNRNALLNNYKVDLESYSLWTDQLLASSLAISGHRIGLLKALNEHTNALIPLLPTLNFSLLIEYEFSPHVGNLDKFASGKDLMEAYPGLMEKEKRYKRSLFGAHLDDFSCIFQNKSSRVYASRGQQKFVVFLLKLAQLSYIKHQGQSAILLIDDFVSDFDETKIAILLGLATQLASQVIITSPINYGPLSDYLNEHAAYIIKL